MATVFKAKDHVLNRFVAVKILRDEFTTDSDFIKKFNSEAQSAASLTHPNIVAIYDVGNEENLYYIVMELIQGKTLKEIINEDGKLSWKWSVNIAIQIASALETAHKNNIIHRDIKPHNIIITEEGLSKVTDFGIAKAVSNSTITAFGTTIGSVHYFSPEHARGEYTDAKSDLYSLGVVMYEMLTGRVPFDADTPVSVALKQVQEEPVDPITYNPNIPVSVNRIILKAMQKDPNLRYQNATEMMADLKMALKRPDEDFVVLAYRDDDSPTQKVPTIYEIEMEKNNDRNAPKLSDKKEDTKKKNKFAEYLSKHKFVKFLLILILIVVLFAIVSVSVMFGIKKNKVKDAYIPVVVGEKEEDMLTEEEAIKKLVEAGFDKNNIKVVKETNDTIPVGYVFSQDPNDGIQHKITEKITIKVSSGPKIVKLPDTLVGRNIDEVKSELEKLGLPSPEITEITDEEKEKGMILAIEPEDCEGEEVEQSRVLKLTVSAGSKYQDVEMKSVIGMGEAEAVSKLENELKLVVEVKYDENTSKPDGTVLAQTIEAGKIIKEQTKVTLTVNKWPEKNTAHFSINVASFYPVSQTPEPTVSTENNDGNTTNSTNSVNNSTPTQKAPDTVTVQIYIGNLPEHTNTSVSKTETNYTYNSNSYTGIKNVRVIIGASTVYNEDVDFSSEQTINISK